MNKIHLFIIALTTVFLFIASCSDDGPSDNNNNNNQSVASCEGCHTNYAHLKAVAKPYVDPGGGGCGGDVPHIEVYDAVYLGGSGFEEYKKSEHYKIACTDCHNGVDKTDDKVVAHGGNFIAKPSQHAQEKCASCHSDIVAGHTNSLHQQGWGQKRKVTMRSGLSGAHEFSKLSFEMQQGYGKNCATCHASCGDCHVNRPHASGGGLLDGHNFSKEPDMLNTCIACHKTRGGHAFLGVAPGTKPDVHQTKGMTCTSCHSQEEIHGDGTIVEHRYAYSKLPACTDCHTGIEKKNMYHTLHWDTFNCQSCHSQKYNSCGSCHVGGEGVRITSYQDFKIAMNPIPDTKPYKFALVRRTPGAPDTFEKFGTPNYSNFDVFPTYNYTTPHNILRWTEVTQVAAGKSCGDNCHIIKEDGKFRNKKLYLFEEDLLEWEIKATKPITVDGKLPASWEVQ
ncbi:MAG: hypothetical protein M9949_09530 [Candidatus Kapabacteria bacterium]|nr:hypothetical protein [Candidatus Kapabacteria bacterium]